MNAVVSLPLLVERAISTLTNARSAAEVLEAMDLASVAYDAAKKAARLGQAKQAHDGLIAAAHRSQADALEIEACAKRRLADEYDAAQERGEVAEHGGARNFKVPKRNVEPTATDLGLSRKDIYEARTVRDAEQVDPGIVRRTLDEELKAGREPTKAKVRRAVEKLAKRKKTKRRPRYSSAPRSAEPEPRHDVDLRRLEVAWEAACESARRDFLTNLGLRSAA